MKKSVFFKSLLVITVSVACVACAKKQKEQSSPCDSKVAISESIQRWEEAIPQNAEAIQDDLDWTVYQELTETTFCFTASRLYLENDKSHEKYLLLETRGEEQQQGTKIPIKARNKLAYGLYDVEYKDSATYEDGYIQAVDYVYVLTPTKLLLDGCPDCRNIYSYILDLETYSAIHIEAYSGFNGIVMQNDEMCLEFFSSDYSSGYRQECIELYDLSGNLLSREPLVEGDE